MTKSGEKIYEKSSPQILKDYLSSIKLSDIDNTAFFSESHEDIKRKMGSIKYNIFLREKITRGYFRENGQLDTYFKSRDISDQIQLVLNKTFLIYDYDLALNFSNDFLVDVLGFLFTFFHTENELVEIPRHKKPSLPIF